MMGGNLITKKNIDVSVEFRGRNSYKVGRM